MIQLWPLILPAAAWSGWWVASRANSSKENKSSNNFSHEYVVGLNYLLNEQPDKAVEVFIKLYTSIQKFCNNFFQNKYTQYFEK